MYESMLDTLARLHSVDVDEAGLGDYGARAGSGLAETPQPGAVLQCLIVIVVWCFASHECMQPLGVKWSRREGTQCVWWTAEALQTIAHTVELVEMARAACGSIHASPAVW